MRSREAILLVPIFLDLLGFGMLIPDIQLRAETLGAPGVVIGALLASTFAVQLVTSPRWGSMSDRIGRKPVLLICTLFSAAGMAMYGFAGSVIGILASRILSGLGGANVAVAQAYLADTNAGANRTAAMGRMGAVMSAGLIIGPVLGGLIAVHGGSRLIGWSAGGASFLGLLILAFGLPRAKPQRRESEPSPPIFDLRLLRENPSLRPLVLAAVVAWFSLAALEGTFGRLIKANLGFGQQEFGLIFGFESALGVVVQAWVLAWLARRMSARKLLVLGYAMEGIGLGLTPFAPGLSYLFLFSGLYAFGLGLANPTVNSVASSMVPDDRQGELFGLLQGTRSVGFILGPIIGGRLFDWANWTPYGLAGITCVGAAVIIGLAVPSQKLDLSTHGVGDTLH